MNSSFRKLKIAAAVIFAGFAVISSESQVLPPRSSISVDSYTDQTAGMTAADAVRAALANNGELLALRNEVSAARSLVKQAALRPNPQLTLKGTKQIGGMDNSQMADVMLPLELGGRRAARIAVAERELEMREQNLANQERLLAADVRLKFAEALAAAEKFAVAERSVAAAKESFNLIAARVTDGRTAPLEENMFSVEVGRLQSFAELAAARTETALFELRNMVGLQPEAQLRLRGDLDNAAAAQFDLGALTLTALKDRPDLRGARAAEQLAAARLEQARGEGRLDASVSAGYQRMNSSFPVSGIDERGALRPVQDVFDFFTFGLQINLPIRNRNQGAVEAAAFDREAARRRLEFGELTVRREVAAALNSYERALRSRKIFESGVRDRAAANLQVIWQTYELGSRNLLDYITEERRVLDLKNEYVDRLLAVYSARVELLRATGLSEIK